MAAIPLGIALLAAGLPACGERGVVGEMHRTFDKGDYEEVVALGRHALRSDSSSAGVHLYYGMALVARGRLHEGFGAIDRAVAIDGDAARKASAFLWERGQAAKLDATAARELAKASELDPALDLGKKRFAVGDVYFNERRYPEAAGMYEAAVRLFPDTAACEDALSRLAECYAFLDRPADARKTMENLVKRYPRGDVARQAWVRLDDISYAEAQKALEAGDLEEAVEVAQALVDRTKNRSLQQKGRLVLGEAYERMGDSGRAYAAYREVIENDRGDSGNVVERARARIEALQAAGLR
ncbi:MAG: tetratricopeptide repeat protein [Candidatus Latescibacteria bacterium]|nr:tetratricopeptide repeat protein [Candidatus Latescibacterota bacterium]